MDHIASDHGIFRFSWMGREMSLSFYPGRGFRLYETEHKESECVVDYPVDEDAFAETMPCGFRFHRQNEEVMLEHSGLIEARQGASLILRATLSERFLEGKYHEELAKEGHATSDAQGLVQVLSVENEAPVYGLGERSGPLDKRGYDYVNWNTDDPSAHVDTFKSLYQSIPFFLCSRGKQSVGVFFDNTSRVRFDVNKSQRDAVLIEYAQGLFDASFFFGSMEEVVSSFTALTGRQPLVPYWALGAQQSRWSYASAKEADEVIRGYQEAGIPLSVLYLDIDYMDRYMDFTVDDARFPDIDLWLKQKSAEGIHVVPIIDAGVKALEGYSVYDEGIANGYFCTLDGETYHNEVWPGDSVFPAFLDPQVRAWWATHVKAMLERGFAGIWNDMNEPASFQGPLPPEVKMGRGISHEMAHNVYGHNMCRASAEGFALASKRLFQLTRAGYAGTCRYSSTWAGDNQSIYDHMRLMLPQMMNMSLSGQAYIGVDIGGFGGDTTPELLCRWAMAAILNPLYRNHSSLGTLSQEPYRLTGKFLRAYKKAVEVRYQILPTLYNELYFAEQEGSAVLRPMAYNYPDNPRFVNENTQIMLGANLLLASSLFPGESKRSVYFPEPFIHFLSGERFETGDHIIDVDVGDCPLFLREKGIAFFAEKDNVETVPPAVLRVFWSGQDATAQYYEDTGDGREYLKGAYNLYEFAFKQGKLTVAFLHHGMNPRLREIILFDGKGEKGRFRLDDVIR